MELRDGWVLGGDPLTPGPGRQWRRRLSRSRCPCRHLLQVTGETQTPCSSSSDITEDPEDPDKVDVFHFSCFWRLLQSIYHLHYAVGLNRAAHDCAVITLSSVFSSCRWIQYLAHVWTNACVCLWIWVLAKCLVEHWTDFTVTFMKNIIGWISILNFWSK